MSSLQQLGTITQRLTLVDTQAIVEQGKKAFRGMFRKEANPFKSDRDRSCWNRGYEYAERQWRDMMARWREMDRGTQM
ncbi:MAG: hypothetical protein C5B59_06590 [Bacteroidetes bacterium]|nr:MAG: hypothetical protein C5B59_06590 [Bacteroidota bacterium]